MINIAYLPNGLSLTRIVFAIIIAIVNIYMFETGNKYKYLSAVVHYLFFCAGSADFLDGLIARSIGATSVTGAILDHISDKVLTYSGLMYISNFQSPALQMIRPILTFSCYVIVIRDILTLGLREYEITMGRVFKVSRFAKIKTFVMMAGIWVMMLGISNSDIILQKTGAFTIIASSILSVLSLAQYLNKLIRNNDQLVA